MSDDLPNAPASATLEATQENERLVEAILAGDREAERSFAMRYMRPVRAMLVARSRNSDVASDLQQDVMIEALCALRRGQLREPAKLTAFVIAIARNVLNNHFRGQVRRPESLELPDNLPDLSGAQDRVEDRQREDLALTAISGLEPMDRKILEMTLVEGLKPGVIADRLRLNPDVVRQRKLRATRRVMEFVQRKSQTISFSHIDTGLRK
jgi:RNA polymerase sigma factor (sigma-70 family)